LPFPTAAKWKKEGGWGREGETPLFQCVPKQSRRGGVAACFGAQYGKRKKKHRRKRRFSSNVTKGKREKRKK